MQLVIVSFSNFQGTDSLCKLWTMESDRIISLQIRKAYVAWVFPWGKVSCESALELIDLSFKRP